MSLTEVVSSRDWTEYFLSLSKAIGFEVFVYDYTGDEIFVTANPPVCNFIKTAKLDHVKCPDSCKEVLLASAQSDKPVIYKCQAGLINFAFSIERSGEKVVIVCRGGFADYEDLRDLIKLVQSNNLPGIPVSVPLNFPGENYVISLSHYVILTVNRLLNSNEEKYRLEEKLLRMTALFDSQTFGTLSKNPQLMYRYILDTVEFVFGPTSCALMLLDESSTAYRVVYSTGKLKDAIADYRLGTEAPVVHELLNTKAAVYSDKTDTDMAASAPVKIKSACYFPFFIGGSLSGMIAVFDKHFSGEDMKIMNAFKDYVQLNLENQNLRGALSSRKKSDERITTTVDFSSSLTSILDKDRLFNTLLEKSLELLNAEQGSLMIVDPETSELVVEARKSIDNVVQDKMRLQLHGSIAEQVLNGGSLLVEDIEQDSRIKQSSRARYKTKSFMSVPIRIEERLAGVINISDKIKGNSFNEDDLTLIHSIISSAAIAIERSILYKRTEDLQKLSITDSLTGIFNRRYLNRRLSEEITRYNRYKQSFSFMMMDMDKFKEYNDTYGHVPGDNLLRDLASTLEKSLRTIDIAARFGGDEFVVIFPQTSKMDAVQITNRLKEKIDNSLSKYDIETPLTMSMGLATFPDDANSIMELIEKTDQALYLAKKAGGNRIVHL